VLFLFIFIAVPIVEIALFIQVGSLIGLWPTLAAIVITAVVGTVLLRQQGLSVLNQARASLEQDRLPVDSVLHGGFLLVAGLLLLTPGFFTDAIGFAFLIPPVRVFVARVAWAHLQDKVQVYSTHGGPGAPPHGDRPPERGDVIDGEAVEIEPERPQVDDARDDRPGENDGSSSSSDTSSSDTSPWRSDR